MEDFHTIPYLQEIIIILVTAGVLVPLFNRLHISPVLGYLIAGFLVGPYGFGSIHLPHGDILNYLVLNNPTQVAHLAEFGVVFLLFMIGLELSPKRLWDMRRMVFGLGLLQVIVSALVIGLIAWAFGNSKAASIVLGACLALSSTAIVMQTLIDRHQIATPLGRTCFSILLFQDLAVVPLLILLGIFGAGATKGVGLAVLMALGKATGIIAILLVAGHFILRPLFRIAGAAKGAEPFMAVTLLTVIVTATMTGMAGLSMALGAFLGGLLLAETEYRHAIEVYIEPFKGLLLGLFFMTVGMGIDPSLIKDNAFWVCTSVFGLIAIKAAIITPAARLFGLTWGTALETGMLLSQAGEFAFVIVGSAMTLGLLSPVIGQFMLVVTSLSMIITPGVAYLAQQAGAFLDKRNIRAPEATLLEVPDMQGHIIVAGVGRVGRAVTRVLEAESIPYLSIDNNMAVVTEKRKLGKPVSYGDASRYDLLKLFHPESAQAIVLTMDDAHDVAEAIKNIRQFWPIIPIFARARDKRVARILHKAGASVVIAETMETSLQLSGSLLKGLGIEEDIILRRLDTERSNAILGIKAE